MAAVSGVLLLGLLAMGSGELYARAAQRPPPGPAGAVGQVVAPGTADGRAAVPVEPGAGRSWPLEGRPPVVRGWEPPATEYGRGHRGVDLGAGPGARVLAAAAGRVSFAGGVAGRGAVVIELAGTGDPPLRTTYEPVRPVVAKGDEVVAGQVVAVLSAGASHCASGCLHWGLRRAKAYLDPLSLLPPSLLRRGPSRLLPVWGVPAPAPP
ncbi:M23 family metallopeptidase [Streptomyces sp. NPDC048332]|uniref:murein hydrolase activator EnvC family protein n=1 Tax=Streptomyces sp. NPDC048332 TaxID=3154619 RepID=UPI00342A58AF